MRRWLVKAAGVAVLMAISVSAMAHGCRVVDNRSLKGAYHGDCDEATDLAEGQGEAIGADRYVGEFVNGRPNGKGTYTWENGARLAGTFKDGKAQGSGIYVSATGARYEGEFTDGKLGILKPADCPSTPGPVAC